MMASSRVPLNPDQRELEHASAKSQGKLALALEAIAIALSLVFGFLYLSSVLRVEREVARLSQQTEGFNPPVERAQVVIASRNLDESYSHWRFTSRGHPCG
jgi:hypothetical protein